MSEEEAATYLTLLRPIVVPAVPEHPPQADDTGADGAPVRRIKSLRRKPAQRS